MASSSPQLTLLNKLLALEYEQMESYAVALKHLANDADRRKLSAFMDEHALHAQALTKHVIALGGGVVDHADLRKVLAKGRVILGAMMGDRAIVEAIRHNEEVTRQAYLQAVSAKMPDDLHALLEQILREELRHSAWIEGRMGPHLPTHDTP
ncbi:MAG: ferritin-like domain-containing protein [Polyangiaceae bacterium]